MLASSVLVGSSVQLLFRAAGFLIVLNSQVLNREKATLSFSYGCKSDSDRPSPLPTHTLHRFDRYEVLFAFSLGIFVMFVTLFVLFEGFERVFAPEPPQLSQCVVCPLLAPLTQHCDTQDAD